jgi:hypothetical protein
LETGPGTYKVAIFKDLRAFFSSWQFLAEQTDTIMDGRNLPSFLFGGFACDKLQF